MGNNDDARTEKSHDDRDARWRRLPKDDRLIYLWWCSGFSESEIATHVGKSLGAVQDALRRAREQVR